MTQDEIVQAAQQAAAQVRAEMEQQPQISESLTMVREALLLASFYQVRDGQRGQAILSLAARLAEQQPAEPSGAAQTGAEAPMIPGRPPGGVIEHPPVPFEETAQGRAEAEHAAAEEARRQAEEQAQAEQD